MRECKLFIDGDYHDAQSGETYQSINPANGLPIANVARADAHDVALACEAAQRAFDGPWGAMTSTERSAIISRAASILMDRAEDFAQMEMLDVGKTITDGRNIDAPGSAAYLQWYSEVTSSMLGSTIPIPNAGQVDFTQWEPYGVVAGIAPWNFPLFLAVLKIGAALATGNSIVMKPASITPITTCALAGIFAEAGLPAGALNVITGSGSLVGEALVTDPHVGMVSFTGSTDTGRRIMQLAQRNITDVSMELGGKSPNIIFADCDFDQAVAGAVFGLLMNNGQNCIAATRLLVEKSLYDRFTAAVAEKLSSLQVGDPSDNATQLGSIVSEEHFNKIMNYIQIGIAEGATLACGGKVPPHMADSGGWFIEPTLFVDATNQMRIAREEIFGPVLTAIPFADEAEAVSIANDTPYGLGSGVFTTNADRARRMANALKSGTVYVNTYNQVYPQSPFPGWKQSGNGVERGLAGLAKYVRFKNIITDISGQSIAWFQ